MVYAPSTIVINTKNGLPGRAGSLTIGTVTEGPAAATITGDPPVQVLNLTLPPGPPMIPSITSQTVSGTSSVATVHEGIVEVTATSAATVTLTGADGTQCAIVWSGPASVVEGVSVTDGKTYVAAKFTAGWKLFEVTAQVADSTAPTPGTLTSSAITDTAFTITVSGASDAGSGLHATPYAFSTDNGTTWTAWQLGAAYNVTGRTALTTYQCKARVRDVAGNSADTAALAVTTTDALYTTLVLHDSFGRANGNIGTAAMDSGQTWNNAVTQAQIVSGRLGPSSSVIWATHGASGALEGTFTFHPPATTVCGVAAAFKSPAGTKGDGWGVKVDRQSNPRDIAQFEGAGITCTFNNGNGSLTSNPWAYLPGADWNATQTRTIRCRINGTTITIYCDGTRILEGTFAGSSGAICYVYGSSTALGLLDELKVLTP